MNHNFKELKIWQRSKELCLTIYKISTSFPEAEKFGLMSQIRRCSVSIPSNIAEGCGRNTDKQLIQFLNISMGSLTELETQIIISTELNFIINKESEIILTEINELQKMINVFRLGLIKRSNV